MPSLLTRHPHLPSRPPNLIRPWKSPDSDETYQSPVRIFLKIIILKLGDPNRRDLVERADTQDLVGATNAERKKKTHYRDCVAQTKFVPFAFETYDAFFYRSDRFLVECATVASKEGGGSRPSSSLFKYGSVRECRLRCNSR